MLGFIARRLVSMVFVMFSISVLVFLIFFATPSRGWVQNLVTPMIRSSRPRENKSSVMLGIKETIRSGGLSKARGVPRASRKVRRTIRSLRVGD